MTVTVNVQDAKTRLSELLRRVERGEEVVIARAGTPIARIQAVDPRGRDLSKPLLPGLPAIPVDELFAEMDEIELADWERPDAADPLENGRTA